MKKLRTLALLFISALSILLGLMNSSSVKASQQPLNDGKPDSHGLAHPSQIAHDPYAAIRSKGAID